MQNYRHLLTALSLIKRCMRQLALLPILIMPVSTVNAADPDVYGLVIGINDYPNFGSLDGAVNDAKDVADALNKVGAKQVVLLQDKTADRDSIFAKWKALVNQSKKDDILIFAYAGHGSQEPEHVKGTEADSLDENFLLGGFKNRDKPSYERIVDDELNALFRETPDRTIIFVADSCHSGTITRSFSGPKTFKRRAIPPLKIENDALTVLYGSKSRSEGTNTTTTKSGDASKKQEGGKDNDMASNIFNLSGVPDDGEVEEITDPETKQPRGALSIAFAKALRNAATNKERGISAENLKHLVTENVRMLTEGRQKLQAAGNTAFVIPIKVTGTPDPTATTATKKPITFTVFVTNVPPVLSDNKWNTVLGQAIATQDSQTASAIWDISNAKIYALGDIIYDGTQNKLQGDGTRAFSRAQPAAPTPTGVADIAYATKVFDKLIAVEKIKQRSSTKTPTMVLKPSDQLHRNGKTVTLEASGQEYPYLTVFNIASDGTINNLYPLQDGNIKDPLEIPLDKPYQLSLNVEPPYGSDHFVVIFSDSPLKGLHKDLQEMNGGANAHKVDAALDRALPGSKYQIGIHGVFTGP